MITVSVLRAQDERFVRVLSFQEDIWRAANDETFISIDFSDIAVGVAHDGHQFVHPQLPYKDIYSFTKKTTMQLESRFTHSDEFKIYVIYTV